MVYDYLKKISPFQNGDKRLNLLWTCNAGGVAGVASWALSIPQDIVKTMQQIHTEEKPMKMSEAYNKIVQDGGIRNLYRGCGPTYLRTYSINIIVLPLYDAIL
jgi:solute carrier family 25 carnitine/acylcarnitine transporter 20/29